MCFTLAVRNNIERMVMTGIDKRLLTTINNENIRIGVCQGCRRIQLINSYFRWHIDIFGYNLGELCDSLPIEGLFISIDEKPYCNKI